METLRKWRRNRQALNHGRQRHWLTLLGFSLLFALSGGASAHVKTGAKDNVLRATLDNGLRVVIVRNTLAPVVTTELNYLAGSNEAPKGFPGMAHAQEHMMFRGSPGLSSAQLAQITASMGGDFDADTQQSVTQYYFTVPADDLDVALHIQAIRMRGVLDSDKLWQKERGAIEQEVARDLSDPQYVMYSKILAAMFKGTPYAHDALGTKASFDKTTGAMLQQFHQHWYAPNNAILVVVGDVQPHKTLRQIRQLFADIPTRKIPARPALHLQPVQPQQLHLKTDLPYGMTAVALRMPGYGDKDYAAAVVLADALSNQRGDLYGLVADGKALGADFSYTPLNGTGLAIADAAFPKGGDGKALLKQVNAILQRVAEHGVPADLVAAAKRDELTSAEAQKNSIAGLASTWSEALAVEGLHSPADELAAIQRVTPQDVQRVARRYLDMRHAIVAVLTPEESGKPISSHGFGGKESFTPEHTRAVKLPEWARRAVSRLSLPRATAKPTEYHLANGLRLIVQPESNSHTVTLYGHIKNQPDLEAPAGQEGVNMILDQLFNFGTATQQRLAFQSALDAIGADESAGTDFGLQVMKGKLARGVALLAANELHPAFRPREFAIVKRQVAASVAGRLHSPDYLAHQAVRKALLPAHDPGLRRPLPKTVNALTLAQVKAYYRKVFRPDLTTIVVIGDITPAAAKRIISQQFGHWQAKGKAPATVLPPIPANKPSTVAVPDRSRVQTEVTLAETLGLNRFNPDYYALQLGNHVLGGGFYATRLYQDLREKTGLVYTVGSEFDVGKTRAVYLLGYACDPGNVSHARRIAERDLREMQTTRVDPQRLRLAKALALRQIPLGESSEGAIAQGLLHYAGLGLPLDEPQRAARHYAKLTPAQVQTAFKKWLRVGDLVQVTQGPAPR